MKRSYLFLFLLLASLVFSSPILAADSTSFDPTKVMVQSIGAIPVGTVITWPSNSWPSDKDNWLECNGQSISNTVYPELVAVVGSTVPDYRGRFLRGVSSGHLVGEKVANSIKSHNHTQPAHTHSFFSQLAARYPLVRRRDNVIWMNGRGLVEAEAAIRDQLSDGYMA